MIDKRHITTALFLALMALVPAEQMEWSRQAIAAGEFWRLFTGHWVHIGTAHLMTNLAGLLVLSWLLPQHPRPIPWILFLLVSPVLISLALLWLLPELDWYRGFSGCLHGLLVYSAILNLNSERRMAGLLLILIALKLFFETVFGSAATTRELIGGQVVTQAHWLGALTGAIMGLPSVFYRRRTERSGVRGAHSP